MDAWTHNGHTSNTLRIYGGQQITTANRADYGRVIGAVRCPEAMPGGDARRRDARAWGWPGVRGVGGLGQPGFEPPGEWRAVVTFAG